jgi:hypothetical protein
MARPTLPPLQIATPPAWGSSTPRPPPPADAGEGRGFRKPSKHPMLTGKIDREPCCTHFSRFSRNSATRSIGMAFVGADRGSAACPARCGSVMRVPTAIRTSPHRFRSQARHGGETGRHRPSSSASAPICSSERQWNSVSGTRPSAKSDLRMRLKCSSETPFPDEKRASPSKVRCSNRSLVELFQDRSVSTRCLRTSKL